MTAGKMAAGYNEAESIVVLNTSGVALSRGETVIWDASAVASTDAAPRITRQTADASAAVAGVLCTDIPISGYGEMFVRGRCKARVHNSVTAGSVLINDYVSGTAAGILKNRVTPGDYPACAYAITAATEEPVAGSGNYWAYVMLIGENMAPIQQVLRGGGVASPIITADCIGKATAFETFITMPPVPGSIISLDVLVETTIAVDAVNTWTVALDHSPWNGTVATCVGTNGATAFTRGTLRVVAAIANFTYTANEVLRISWTPAAAAVTLAAVRIKHYVRFDTGIQAPVAYGR